MKIIEDKKNSLLNRREVKAIVDAAKNPSFPEASKTIAEHFKANEEFVAVKEIKGKFGRNTFLVQAFIYNTKEDKAKFETKKEKAAVAAK